MKRATAVFVVLLAFGICSCNQTQPGTTTILIVRHAEKASDAEDSPLTDAGRERAQALVRVAEDAGVSVIYSTQFQRNRDTAKPLSERLGVGTTEVPVNLTAPGDYGKTLAGEILKKHAGRVVLVVGHGNTIASIVEGLIGRSPKIDAVAYHDLFVINVPASGTPQLIKARYGLSVGN
jgi:broad specificity phosphatase PhoE